MGKRELILIVSGIVMLLGCGCGKNSEQTNKKMNTEDLAIAPTATANLQKIEITSESLTEDGEWKTDICAKSANPAGQNMIPQLSWNAVEGASGYAIYMYDTSANYWLHWKVANVTTTSVKMGEKIDGSKYIGPYPPSGTHMYEITVYALKTNVEKAPGMVDTANRSSDANESMLDSSTGTPGNIIGKGTISGKVTMGSTVE